MVEVVIHQLHDEHGEDAWGEGYSYDLDDIGVVYAHYPLAHLDKVRNYEMGIGEGFPNEFVV